MNENIKPQMAVNWHNAEIIASYGKFHQLPPQTLPEIAFSGRSNVGKSSLINKLLNRKSLARVSSRPGKTITINYFDIDKKIFIVDLPGYGYAKIAKSEKERFSLLIEKYLQSERISLLVQLLDFRHPPSKDDLMMLDFLRQTDMDYVIILTKADKLKKREREKMREIYKEYKEVIEFSSETGEGVDDLRAFIEEYVAESTEGYAEQS
ncbi:MAG: ribosome biogenesis GTP-binding protein YihA/YsxC [Oscillospiraceae bacterium]|nr:ribosome biogenesis GTP-binding protein YihA/YsxC [Oscillospiraceae bacterium]